MAGLGHKSKAAVYNAGRKIQDKWSDQLVAIVQRSIALKQFVTSLFADQTYTELEIILQCTNTLPTRQIIEYVVTPLIREGATP
jgi:hypothetical protein